jgi:hypothetical protein
VSPVIESERKDSGRSEGFLEFESGFISGILVKQESILKNDAKIRIYLLISRI